MYFLIVLLSTLALASQRRETDLFYCTGALGLVIDNGVCKRDSVQVDSLDFFTLTSCAEVGAAEHTVSYYDLSTISQTLICHCKYNIEDDTNCSDSLPGSLQDYVNTALSFSTNNAISKLQKAREHISPVLDSINQSIVLQSNIAKQYNDLIDNMQTMQIESSTTALAVISSVYAITKMFVATNSQLTANTITVVDKAFGKVFEAKKEEQVTFLYDEEAGMAALFFIEKFFTSSDTYETRKELFRAAMSPSVAQKKESETVMFADSYITYSTIDSINNCYASLTMTEKNTNNGSVVQTIKGTVLDFDGKYKPNCEFIFGVKFAEESERLSLIQERLSGDLECSTSATMIHSFACGSPDTLDNPFTVTVKSEEPEISTDNTMYIVGTIVLCSTFGLMVLPIIFIIFFVIICDSDSSSTTVQIESNTNTETPKEEYDPEVEGGIAMIEVQNITAVPDIGAKETIETKETKDINDIDDIDDIDDLNDIKDETKTDFSKPVVAVLPSSSSSDSVSSASSSSSTD